MILATDDTMTIDKLAVIADRIVDAGTPTISSVSTPTESGDFRTIVREEVAPAMPTQERSRPGSLLDGIEEVHVGTVHVGVPGRVANRLGNNREIKRASVGIIIKGPSHKFALIIYT